MRNNTLVINTIPSLGSVSNKGNKEYNGVLDVIWVIVEELMYF